MSGQTEYTGLYTIDGTTAATDYKGCEGADIVGVLVKTSSTGSLRIDGFDGTDTFTLVAAAAVSAGDFIPVPGGGLFETFRAVRTAGSMTVKLAVMRKDR